MHVSVCNWSFWCLVLFEAKSLSQEQQSKSSSKVKPHKHSSNLQVQAHWRLVLKKQALVSLCSSLLGVSASVSAAAAWCLLPLWLFLVFCVCVNLNLLRLMPLTAPAPSFIAAHYPLGVSLSLSLPTPCVCQVPPTPLLPSLPAFRAVSQSPHQNKHMRREYLCVSMFLGVGALICMCVGG